MKEYLIEYMEKRANELHIDISVLYDKVAELYQDDYGVNIKLQAKEHGLNMVDYLDSLDMLDDGFKMRFITLVNKL